MTKRYHHGDLRSALLQAAREILAERGPDGFSLRDCARRAGVSHAAPTHHFGDVKGLLTAVATDGFLALSLAMRRSAEAAPKTPADQLIALGRAYVEQAVNDPGAFRVMFRPMLLHLEDPAFKQAASDARAALQSGIEQLRRPDEETPELQKKRAVLAWAAVHGLAFLLLDGPLAREFADPAEEIAGPLAQEILTLLTGRLAN